MCNHGNKKQCYVQGILNIIVFGAIAALIYFKVI